MSFDFSNLSSPEIARLFNETRKLAVQEKYGARPEDQPTSPRGGNSPYHQAPDGSICDCGNVASHYPEPERFYQSESGAMVRLEAGENRPASLADERTERLCRMPKNEVERLSDDARAELMEFREGVLEQRSQEFRAARPKYNPTEENRHALVSYLANENIGYGPDGPDDDAEIMTELLTRGLWDCEQLCAAYDHLSRRGELTPLPGDVKKLDAQQTLELSAMCSTARTDDDFENILDQYLLATTGSSQGARRLVLDHRYVKAVSAGVYFIFANSTPEFQETAEAKQFLKRYVGNRFVSVRLLRAGYAAYLKAKENGEIEQDQTVVQSKPSPEEETLQRVNEIAREISRASWDGL